MKPKYRALSAELEDCTFLGTFDEVDVYVNENTEEFVMRHGDTFGTAKKDFGDTVWYVYASEIENEIMNGQIFTDTGKVYSRVQAYGIWKKNKRG
jgi:hypothetical protein